jgi:hypothetical protein
MDVATAVPPGSGFRMAIRYYDHAKGRDRLKARYRWAATAFAAGLILGMTCAHIM